MELKELFQLARDYQIIAHDINKAIIFYREIVERFPGTIEAEYAQTQIEAYNGIWMEQGLISIPLYLSPEKQQYGGIEYVNIGKRAYKVNIPSGIRVGQKIRLRGVANQIDPRLRGGDVYLIVNQLAKEIYKVKRDVQLELPINFNSIGTKALIKRVNIRDKKIDLKIPMDSKPGRQIRIKNYAQYCNGGYEGDVYFLLVQQKRSLWNWWGVFDSFAEVQETRFNVKFKLPLILELAGEWKFRTSEIHVGIGK